MERGKIRFDKLEKLDCLKKILESMGSVLVAYSGGVDSTFLLKVAKDVLNENVLAVIASSPLYPKRELEHAEKMARDLGVKYAIIETDEINKEEFVKNSRERCYFCKKELFSNLVNIAKERGINYVIDGTNIDDIRDIRPGIRAGLELDIKSPLKDAGLKKDEIRSLSKKFNLPTWNKPSFACLASRFSYGEPITKDWLKRISLAEEFLFNLGFTQVRVRCHKDIARIETEKKKQKKVLQYKDKIISYFRKLGYTYITLDLEGYRMGSMNEV